MRHECPGEGARTAQRSCRTGTSFIGSFLEEPDQATIVLRGDIDASTVTRVDVHVEGVRAAGVRFLVIDATAVDSFDEALLDLLGRVQHRLGGCRGLLQVRGLHPSLLVGSVAAPVVTSAASTAES